MVTHPTPDNGVPLPHGLALWPVSFDTNAGPRRAGAHGLDAAPTPTPTPAEAPSDHDHDHDHDHDALGEAALANGATATARPGAALGWPWTDHVCFTA
jgi:hypothetical protein